MRFPLLLLCLLLCTCVLAQTTVAYQSSPEDFPNPERGFYHYTETRASDHRPLDPGYITGLRQSTVVDNANHAVVSSLIFRYFFLDDFTGGPISQTFLDAIAADFTTIRQAGMKIIPRFAYTNEVDGSGCPSFICPPYGDAPKAIVLQHIGQLAPILAANADVTAVVQMGFIGTWGENYYTDFFGDASPEGGQGRLLDENWQDRFEVLNALLAAVPASRAVQVRYPQMKQRTVYGINAPTNSAPLTMAEAYDGSAKARIGFHNDCLLAGAYDYGTYEDYGNSGGFGGPDSTNLKPYFAADSRFVPVGGETCDDDNYDPENNCVSSGGIADFELRRLHYSYLNVGYNQDVNNDWQTGGCMEDIKRGLGYRFELQSGTYPGQLGRGDGATFGFTLVNRGYAAPYNQRRVELILRNTATDEVWLAPLNTDPRFWDRESGQHTVTEQLCVPSDMPAGTYDLLLHLPAPEATLYGRPDYSVRLANRLQNAEVWEAATGYNDLGHQVNVSGSGSSCTGGTEFISLLASLPVEFTAVSARVVDKSIQLRWSTANEVDNDHFIVERSTGGTEFGGVGRVDPSTTGRYGFTDDNVVEGKTYYYRIRQVDLDGTPRLSSVVSARLLADRLLQAYPNPGRGVVTLNRTDGELTVFDHDGRSVPVVRSAGSVRLPVGRTGVYLLRLRLETGELLSTRVVIR